MALLESSPGPPDASAVADAITRLQHLPDNPARASLLEPLQQSPPDIELARGRLRLALGVSAPVDPSLAGSRSVMLDEIMGVPPFATRELKSAAPGWLIPVIVVLEWLLQHIVNIVRWPFDRLGDLISLFVDGPGFLPSVTALALAGIVALILLYRRGLRAALVAEAAIAAETRELPPTSEEAIARAQRLASSGDYREATHYLLLSTLLRIEERGYMRFDRAATNREHLEQIHSQAGIASVLRPLVDRFDRLWYGQREVSAPEFHELEQLTLRAREAIS